MNQPDDVMERVAILLSQAPKPAPFPCLDDMTKEEFDAMMAESWAQAQAGIGHDLDEVHQMVMETIYGKKKEPKK